MDEKYAKIPNKYENCQNDSTSKNRCKNKVTPVIVSAKCSAGHEPAEAREDRRLHGRRDASERAPLPHHPPHHLRQGAQQDR